MTFLLGRQAMFGQEPPTYLRSMTATFFPWEARVQARYLPASPLPSTTTSYSSAMDSVTFWYGRTGPRGGRERRGPRVDGPAKSRREAAPRHSAASAIIEWATA